MDIEVTSRREGVFMCLCVCEREKETERDRERQGKALQHLAYDQVTQFTRVTFFFSEKERKSRLLCLILSNEPPWK